MEQQLESYERWTPRGDLPECPLVEVNCAFEGGELTAKARYAREDAPNNLLIGFGYVEAFKLYEEFSDPWMATGSPLPSIESHEWNRYRCPLQQVMHSNWIARILARNGGKGGYDWRHYVIATMDRNLHVMTSEDPKTTTFE